MSFTFIILTFILFNYQSKADQEIDNNSFPNTRYERTTSTYVVAIDGTETDARRLAQRYGFFYKGQLPPNYFILQSRQQKLTRSMNSRLNNVQALKLDRRVIFLQQQIARVRVKRSIEEFDDPLWPKMWYLNRGARASLDMNVQKAWARGYSGQGIVITVLDDGIEYQHPDLQENYDQQASYDYNNDKIDPSPRQNIRSHNDQNNHHGTRCAGVIASIANNKLCGIGVAYSSKIGGIRMLDGDVTDVIEARALSHNRNHVDIYSSSWGPDDNGMKLEGPAHLTLNAFREGVLFGRSGLGSIFVWASGNGGSKGDDCNCDGYTNSIYTIGISSVSENARVPWYSEKCSSTLAAAFSSNDKDERAVITTDLNGQCIDNHTGTSASAPIATGICAITLSANPKLSWRDMQHIIVRTSRSEVLSASDWATNAAGYRFSHSFGFGLMDANAMVTNALNWTSVPLQHECEERWHPLLIHEENEDNVNTTQSPSLDPQERINYERKQQYNLMKMVVMNDGVNSGGGPIVKDKSGPLHIPPNTVRVLHLPTNACQRQPMTNAINYLEHVQVKITLRSDNRGQVSLCLTSPSGTVSQLLHIRKSDASVEGFNAWPFMTVHFWGENPRGIWKLNVSSGNSNVDVFYWTLVLYGTEENPYNVSSQSRSSSSSSSSVTMRQTSAEKRRHTLPESVSGDALPRFVRHSHHKWMSIMLWLIFIVALFHLIAIV